MNLSDSFCSEPSNHGLDQTFPFTPPWKQDIKFREPEPSPECPSDAPSRLPYIHKPMDLYVISTCCIICEHQVGAEACSRWGSDSWSHPNQENSQGNTTMDVCFGLAMAHSLLQGQGSFPALPRILLWKENWAKEGPGFYFWFISRIWWRIVVASRQRQAGSGIKLCLASVERLKCFGSLRKCPFHFRIDWSLLNTHTPANAAFGGFSLGLFSFYFFHDFKCFWQ